MTADSFERTFSVSQLRAITTGQNLSINSVPPRALYLGTAGDVTILAAEDTGPVTLTGLAAGVFHPIAFTRVVSVGVATGLVAGW